MTPTGTSMALTAEKYILLSRLGGIFGTRPTTLSALSINMTSMANRMKNIWMELQCVMIRPSPFRRESCLSKPIMREGNVSAKVASSAITEFLD